MNDEIGHRMEVDERQIRFSNTFNRIAKSQERHRLVSYSTLVIAPVKRVEHVLSV